MAMRASSPGDPRRSEPPAGYREGLAHLEAGRLEAALAALERAHRAAPADAAVLFALATAARRLGLSDAAMRLCREVLALEPARLEAIVTLANLHRARGESEAAIACLKPAIEAAPEAAELWLTLGHTVREAGDCPAARSFYEEALRLRPSYVEAIGSLADLASDARDHERARTLYDRAVRLERNNAQLRLNRAVLLLHLGALAEGWRDYEWRLRLPAKAVDWQHGLPRWDGRLRKGLKLLVTAEQGIGDQILFASLLPELKAALSSVDGALIVDCEPRLVPLLARMLPASRIEPQRLVETGGHRTASYEWLDRGAAMQAVPMGSLPRHLRTDLAQFPSPHAYLRPEPEEGARWRAWLAGLGEGPFVGLCWRSGKSGGLRAQQFAAPEAWAAAMAAHRGAYISLQYDAQEAECLALAARAGCTLHVPPGLDQKREIDRAAGLMAALDAVISAPTAVASLSAALGVPTAKVLFDKSWTALGQPFEPFQPACRLASPAMPGDFSDALSRAFTLVGIQPVRE